MHKLGALAILLGYQLRRYPLARIHSKLIALHPSGVDGYPLAALAEPREKSSLVGIHEWIIWVGCPADAQKDIDKLFRR